MAGTSCRRDSTNNATRLAGTPPPRRFKGCGEWPGLDVADRLQRRLAGLQRGQPRAAAAASGSVPSRAVCWPLPRLDAPAAARPGSFTADARRLPDLRIVTIGWRIGWRPAGSPPTAGSRGAGSTAAGRPPCSAWSLHPRHVGRSARRNSLADRQLHFVQLPCAQVAVRVSGQ